MKTTNDHVEMLIKGFYKKIKKQEGDGGEGDGGVVMSADIYTPTFGARGKNKNIKKSLIVGKHKFNVELPNNPVIGLGNRESMQDNEGMLFLVDTSGNVIEHPKFTMDNMRFPLDFVCIGYDNKIFHLEYNVPAKENMIISLPPCKAVLEVNAGIGNTFNIGDDVSNLEEVMFFNSLVKSEEGKIYARKNNLVPKSGNWEKPESWVNPETLQGENRGPRVDRVSVNEILDEQEPIEHDTIEHDTIEQTSEKSENEIETGKEEWSAEDETEFETTFHRSYKYVKNSSNVVKNKLMGIFDGMHLDVLSEHLSNAGIKDIKNKVDGSVAWELEDRDIDSLDDDEIIRIINDIPFEGNNIYRRDTEKFFNEPLTVMEAQSVVEYSNHSKDINGMSINPNHKIHIFLGQTKEERLSDLQAFIKGIDGAIKKAKPSDEDNVFYRGVQRKHYNVLYGKKDDIWKGQKNYMSTSLFYDRAFNFSEGGETMLKINVPAGSKFITLDAGVDSMAYEKERILPRGEHFGVSWNKADNILELDYLLRHSDDENINKQMGTQGLAGQYTWDNAIGTVLPMISGHKGEGDKIREMSEKGVLNRLIQEGMTGEEWKRKKAEAIDKLYNNEEISDDDLSLVKKIMNKNSIVKSNSDNININIDLGVFNSNELIINKQQMIWNLLIDNDDNTGDGNFDVNCPKCFENCNCVSFMGCKCEHDCLCSNALPCREDGLNDEIMISPFKLIN